MIKAKHCDLITFKIFNVRTELFCFVFRLNAYKYLFEIKSVPIKHHSN